MFGGADQVAVGFAAALLGGDVTAALAYFGEGSRLLTPDGTEVSGRMAISEVLRQVTISSQKLEIRPGRTLVADGIALSRQSWRWVATGAESFERRTSATLVLRHDTTRWRILIAAPWGQ